MIKQWYAVYTAPRAEKKVSDRFREAAIEHYLPLKKVRRRWSDRIKDVVVPVVNGYIFVYIQPTQFREILQVYGAISFVREQGVPAAIPDEQIKQLRFMVDYSDEDIEICVEDFIPGELVTVNRGPLVGLTGELVNIKGKHKVLIRLDKFGCALTTIPLSFLTKA